jgi:hypothetical protein
MLRWRCVLPFCQLYGKHDKIGTAGRGPFSRVYPRVDEVPRGRSAVPDFATRYSLPRGQQFPSRIPAFANRLNCCQNYLTLETCRRSLVCSPERPIARAPCADTFRMAALQVQPPRPAQLAVRNASALPSQFNRPGAPSLHRVAPARRTAHRIVVSAKLAKSEPKGPPPAVSVREYISCWPAR